MKLERSLMSDAIGVVAAVAAMSCNDPSKKTFEVQKTPPTQTVQSAKPAPIGSAEIQEKMQKAMNEALNPNTDELNKEIEGRLKDAFKGECKETFFHVTPGAFPQQPAELLRSTVNDSSFGTVSGLMCGVDKLPFRTESCSQVFNQYNTSGSTMDGFSVEVVCSKDGIADDELGKKFKTFLAKGGYSQSVNVAPVVRVEKTIVIQ